MEKVAIFAVLLLTFTPQIASAQSSATVEVNNNVSSISNTDTEVKTNIRVETNGKVTEYSSHKSQDVKIKVEDGKSEIKVDGEQVLGDESTSTNSPTLIVEKEKEDLEKEDKNIIEVIQSVIKGLFSLLV